MKLQPNDDQRQLLYKTLERANAACNWMSHQVWAIQAFSQSTIHRLTYYPVREQFELTAQLAVRCVGKVVDAYKKDRKTKRLFRKHGAIPYDNRILNWRIPDLKVSIWVLGGRETMPFVTGDHQLELLQYQQGESDLFYRRGNFYLVATCDVPANAPIDSEGWLGIDMGIANIATDNTGEQYSGSHLKSVRHRHRRLRQKLQKKQTDSARRKLKQLSGREYRFASNTNHTISKHIVAKAQRHSLGIALEDLGGIRARITVRRAQRVTLHSWSFSQLRAFIEYKGARRGIPVVKVNPRNTSRQCSVCGHIDKASRKTQSSFSCTSCGHAAHADVNAAINIGRRAGVTPPNVGSIAD
ncbi:MAG TPA: transposase [Phototrophicaceae bacterium]|nr:transposase [Phototrophicaceae bacterium]